MSVKARISIDELIDDIDWYEESCGNRATLIGYEWEVSIEVDDIPAFVQLLDKAYDTIKGGEK